jgi:hypothetical protein
MLFGCQPFSNAITSTSIAKGGSGMAWETNHTQETPLLHFVLDPLGARMSGDRLIVLNKL